MFPAARPLLLRFVVAFLLCQTPLFAQWIQPSGGDPVEVACPSGPASGEGINALDAWEKGKDAANIEGDGFMGIGNWGHTLETLQWYCKSSAAGNAIASFEIAEIFREGYVVNSEGPSGQIITKHYEPDMPTAFYWYQLSSKRGFTKGMLAEAQFYALGSRLDGSHVAQDPAKASSLLSEAADDEDTTALLILASRYAGVQTVPWAMAIPITEDRAKALDYFTKAIKILKQADAICTDSDTLKSMVDDLPDVSDGRAVQGAFAIEMHGTDSAYPMEAECLLTLGQPPESQQDDESALGQFYSLIHGGQVSSWTFSFTQIPGNDQTVMYRETATQAMTEGIEEIQALVQLLAPPGPSQSTQ
jgi:hypothetical protein